jgi:lipoprotein NlpI
MRFTLWPLLLALFLGLPLRPAVAAEILTADELLQQADAAWQKGSRAEAIAMCTQAILADPKNLKALALRGRYHYESRQDVKAIADFDEVLKRDPTAAGLYQLRGWSKFRLGKFDESIADFDRVIALVPAQEPQHWQRGIVYYYAKRFADGRKQFELHQTVNPNDVENAVWHYLCVARLVGVDKARATLIPIEGDGRVPMMQVHALFEGKAKPEDVLKAAETGDLKLARRNRQLFYAHLYLGLYFEAAGDALQAREHILKAASDYTSDDYMGDVARVHAQLLKKQRK